MNTNQTGSACLSSETDARVSALVEGGEASTSAASARTGALPTDQITRLARLGAAVAMVLGAWISGCWLLGQAQLATLHLSYWPPPPRAGAAFLALGTLCWLIQRGTTLSSRRWPAAGIVMVTLFGLWSVLEECRLVRFAPEALFLTAPKDFDTIQVFSMSLTNVLTCSLISLGLLGLLGSSEGRLGRLAGWFGLGSALLNFAVFFSYLQPGPFVHDSWLRPTSTFCALGGLVLSLSLVLLVGPRRPPLEMLLGPSIQARLLRGFLPLTFLALFVVQILNDWLLAEPVHGSAGINTLIASAVVGLAILHAARLVARDLNQAQAAQRDAEAALRASRDSLEIRVRQRTAELEQINESLKLEIDQRRRAEEALRESERKFRQVVEHIREVFWISDPAKRHFDYVSPGYDAIWGRSRETLKHSAKDWLEAVHPEERDRVWDAALNRQRTGQYDETYRIVRPDGQIRWIQDRAFPVTNPNGEVYRIVGLAEDITTKVYAEATLRDSERRFRTLFAGAPIGIALHGPDGRYVEVNRAYCEMLGYDEAELLELGVRRVTQPEDAGEGQRLFQELLAGRLDYYDREKRFVAKDGRIVNAHSAASAVRNPDGGLQYIISTVVDITERRRMRAEILDIGARERERLGHELHDGLGQYLTGLALKARCLADALQVIAPAHAPEAQTLMKMINTAIGDTRRLARGLDPIEVEIGGLLAALERLVQESEISAGIPCSFRHDQSAVAANPSQSLHLFRIAQEALNNSVKHACATQIIVELRQDSRQLELVVRDDGVGFDPEQHRGSGLGLRTMRYRADTIGAQLRIRALPERGISVECRLPLNSS